MKVDKNLLGTWKCLDDDSAVRIVIKEINRKLIVEAFNYLDGEKYEISDLKFTPDGIGFILHVPSSGYSTRNCIRLLDEGDLEVSYTITERFCRIPE